MVSPLRPELVPGARSLLTNLMLHIEMLSIRLCPADLTPVPGAKQSGPEGKLPLTVLLAMTVLAIVTLPG